MLNNIDIFDEFKFNGKELIETGHFKKELYDVYRKNLDIAVEILDKGVHSRESKSKIKAELKTFKGVWELVYAENGEIVLIHLKLRR